uniref:NIPSNAP domain-containing protein n=1 Tax=Eutreptiella gymnastica TaxID=73025 RepID=A0A7S4GBX5_9EUGL
MLATCCRLPRARLVRCYSTTAPPIFELRTYNLIPQHAATYLEGSAVHGNLRKTHLPLLFFGTVETGGQLNTVQHLYKYPSLEARDDARKAAAADPNWQMWLKLSRTCVERTQSIIFNEAKAVLDANSLPGADGHRTDSKGIYEFRQYQLRLGYPTVPNFLKFYGAGLPSKLAADKRAQLVTLLYSDLGPLNIVIEIWRHDSPSAMMDSRVASREATEWKTAIGNIADLAHSFQNTILIPQSFSPWQ